MASRIGKLPVGRSRVRYFRNATAKAHLMDEARRYAERIPPRNMKYNGQRYRLHALALPMGLYIPYGPRPKEFDGQIVAIVRWPSGRFQFFFEEPSIEWLREQGYPLPAACSRRWYRCETFCGLIITDTAKLAAHRKTCKQCKGRQFVIRVGHPKDKRFDLEPEQPKNQALEEAESNLGPIYGHAAEATKHFLADEMVGILPRLRCRHCGDIQPLGSTLRSLWGHISVTHHGQLGDWAQPSENLQR